MLLPRNHTLYRLRPKLRSARSQSGQQRHQREEVRANYRRCQKELLDSVRKHRGKLAKVSDLLFCAYDKAYTAGCSEAEMVDGKDPEWLKGGIMNDGFVMQSFNGMIDKDEVKRQLGARRIQCVACYA